MVAFGNRYALHRLLLDRAPFFSSALSEPWFESSAKEITLHPEDVDPTITQGAFELALKRIYGCQSLEEEGKDPISLLATGCWLEMADLIEASINAILQQMVPAKLASYIKFVTSNYYGKHGHRILNAAKAMLCREGYEMPLRDFDGISGDIVREIIGSDGFYAPGEWERWVLARRILNRRLKQKATEAGIIGPDRQLVKPRPASLSFMALRFDTVYRNTGAASALGATAEIDQWLGLYTHPDIAPLLVLLDEGIHYVHMSFEQLQKIREQRDVLGVPLMPEKVISNALWMSMELRQRILNAGDSDLKIGLSQEVEYPHEPDDVAFEEGAVEAGAGSPSQDPGRLVNHASQISPSEKAAGKKPVAERDDSTDDDEEIESDSWDGNAKPRKFWIPLVDATYPMGGAIDSTASGGRSDSKNRQASGRFSASLDPQDMQWATDFASTAQDRSDTPTTPTVANTPSPEVQYTHFPPFRFSAEFPSAKSLKPDKRIYSNTVWYAGSLWNVYVQKKESARSTQLGIYLHREKQIDRHEEVMSGLGHYNTTVDERITSLERELLVRRQGVQRRMDERRRDLLDQHPDDTATSGSSTLVPRLSQDLDTISGLLRSHNSITKASEASLTLSSPADRRFNTADAFDADDEEVETDAKIFKVPTLSRYLDSRPTIKTYFKIYTPSKGGRMLSVYESAPDKFNFSQSWGWKSSNLVVDDGAVSSEEEGRVREPRMRFMVVIGKLSPSDRIVTC